MSSKNMSPSVRDTLLKLERVRKIKDPFSVENQVIIQAYLDSVQATTSEDIMFTEMANQLGGVMNLWKCQVGSCISDIYNMRAFVTNTQPFVMDDQSDSNDDLPVPLESIEPQTTAVDDTAMVGSERLTPTDTPQQPENTANVCDENAVRRNASDDEEPQILMKPKGIIRYSYSSRSQSNKNSKRMKKSNSPKNQEVFLVVEAVTLSGPSSSSDDQMEPDYDMLPRNNEEQSATLLLLVDEIRKARQHGFYPTITIMDKISEKTFGETQFRMRKMIETMQKSIVSKYREISRIEENSAEFSYRIKSFEDRIKEIFAIEAKREKFDICKYENVVLEAAKREVQDQDTDSGENTCKDMQIQSPSTSSSNVDSQKWVPLTQIFTLMKTMDKKEVCRFFFAVVALLSYQNLEMKYENHYSPESATITSNCLDHAQDKEKYSRGLKIMASRCSDLDTEEIYLNPLATNSRTNAFRQLELHESDLDFGVTRMMINENSGSSDEVVNGDLTHDIEREFIMGECPVYQGRLVGKSRARKVSNINNEPKQLKTERF